jgi:lipopolysaccharide transport system ATP-binding protein
LLVSTSDRPPPQYFREFWALHDVSFQVKKGETLGIVGRNGSGKSTILQLICGTLSPTRGDVTVKGRISALLELGSGFNPDYTGRENVFLNGQILGLSQKEIDSRYKGIVEFADIGDFIDQPIKTYSSGMVVRLAFSVAINVDPEILIVDEALAVGDMPFQIKCFAHLRKLRESGTSILFVSHDLSTVRSFCDRAVYLDHGKCLAIGPANDVCRQYEFDCLKNKFLPSKFDDANVNYSETLSEENREFVSNEILKYLQSNRAVLVEKEHEGSQSLTIESFIIVGQDGIPIESIEPKQDVTAYALLRLNKPLSQNFHVGIQIHDRQGMPLMTVRDSAFEDIISGDEGDAFVVSMRFSLPLKAGQYYCQAGVLLFPLGEKYADWHSKFEHAEVADIVEHAAYFSMLLYQRHYITVPVLNETKMKILAVKGPSSRREYFAPAA